MKMINYETSMGEYKYPDGFKETLEGLSIEEQMLRFRTTTWSRHHNTHWKSRTYARPYCHIDKDSNIRAIVVDKGFICGVIITDENGRDWFCMPEDYVCTYYASDNNGAGYKERMDFTHFVCVSENFEEEK